jgi:hypothetical protein
MIHCHFLQKWQWGCCHGRHKEGTARAAGSEALEGVPPNLRPLCIQNLERKAKADGNLDLLRAIKDYRSLLANSPQSSRLTSGATKAQKSKARNGSIDESQRHFETLTIEQLFDAIDSMALEPEVSFNCGAAAMLLLH